jgi:ribosomal protein L31
VFNLIARLLVVILLAGTLHAAPAPLSLKWSELEGAIHFEDLIVELKDGSTLKASESSVEQSALAVDVSSNSHPTYKKGRSSIPRDQIAGLRLIKRGKGRGIALTAGVVGPLLVLFGLLVNNMGQSSSSGGTAIIVAGVAVIPAGIYIGSHLGRQEIRITILPD